MSVTLRPYACTIRVFDPGTGETLESHVLPVDSPDAEHAAASTLANAASFVQKISGEMDVRSVAFSCIKVERRG